MSSNFDSLFDQVASKNKKSPSPEQKSTNFDTLFDEVSQKQKPKRSTFQDIEHAPETLARGAYSGLASTPRALSGLLKYGSKSLAEKGRKSEEEQGIETSATTKKFTDYVVNVLGYPEELLEKFGLPTYQEATEWARKRQGENEHEPSGLEKGLETAGSVIGGSLITPGGSFGSAARAATTGLAATGAGVASGLGAESGGQIAGALGLPAIVQAISLIKSGKLMPTGAQAKELYEVGKQMGLTDAELTPIIQSQGKKRLLGGIAQPTKRADRAIQASESALGNLYDKVKESASAAKPANRSQTERLLIRFEDVADKLRKSKIKADDKRSAISKIEEAISDIGANGISPDEIISTWQDINQAINWRSFKEGKKSLAALKEPLGDLLKEIDPKIAKDFQNVNKMWGKLQDTAAKVRPTEYSKFVKMGEIGALMSSLYKLASTGNPISLGVYMSEKSARRLATEMLTNPKLNNLINKTLASASKGTRPAVIKSLRELEKGLREFPDIDEGLDFPELID